MDRPTSRLLEFILEKSEGEPASRRIQLYHCLAEILPPEETAAVRKLAIDLEGVQNRSRQLLLDFRAKQLS